MSQIAASATASPPDEISHHFLHTQVLFLLIAVSSVRGRALNAVTRYAGRLTLGAI